MYQTKLLKFGVQTVLSSNRIKFEQYGGLLDEAYSSCNAYMLDNQDPFDQIENDKTVEVVYSSEQDDKNTGSKRNSATINSMPRIKAADKILESIYSLYL